MPSPPEPQERSSGRLVGSAPVEPGWMRLNRWSRKVDADTALEEKRLVLLRDVWVHDLAVLKTRNQPVQALKLRWKCHCFLLARDAPILEA
mmetsp:Transcript_29428/g.68249  ORF Transcript_29428/g.68249 Transcript_29428/m.68249 type:complete len:91 (+) Transcript_29428:47-319(+)